MVNGSDEEPLTTAVTYWLMNSSFEASCIWAAVVLKPDVTARDRSTG